MRNKIALIAFAVILVIGVSMTLFSKKNDLQTVSVTRESIAETISQTGNINAGSQTVVYAQSTGLVEDIYVKNGETVIAGQDLLKIKSTSTEKDKAAAYAAYLAAVSAQKTAEQGKLTSQSQLESARKSVLDAVAAQKTLNDNLGASKSNPTTGKAYTQEEIDAINSSLTSARQNFSALEQKYKDIDTSIQSAKAGTLAAKSAYDATKDSVVTAPVSGRVTNLQINLGDNVTTVTTNTSSSSQLLTIANLDYYKLSAFVTETDIAKIQIYSPVKIVFEAIPDVTYTGKIQRLDDIGSVKNGLVSYGLDISLDSPDSRIRSGMTATIDIAVQSKSDVLAAPISAVTQDGDKKYVLLQQNGKQIKQEVQTGISNGARIEIISGVNQGDTLIIDTKK